MPLHSLGFTVGAIFGGSKGIYHGTKKYNPYTKTNIYKHSILVGLGLSIDAISTFTANKVVLGQFSETFVTNTLTHSFFPIFGATLVSTSLFYYGGHAFIKSFQVPEQNDSGESVKNNTKEINENHCGSNKKE